MKDSDVNSGKLLHTLDVRAQHQSVAIEGNKIVSGSWDDTVKFWIGQGTKSLFNRTIYVMPFCDTAYSELKFVAIGQPLLATNIIMFLLVASDAL